VGNILSLKTFVTCKTEPSFCFSSKTDKLWGFPCYKTGVVIISFKEIKMFILVLRDCVKRLPVGTQRSLKILRV